MKTVRTVITLLFVLATTAAFAQSDAQKSFDKMKTLAGTWEGRGPDGNPVQVAFKITANGSALMSEIKSEDDMVSVIHLDGARLLMTHYCGSGNQPRMQGTLSPDGKSIDFNFVDATNLAGPQAGHMHRAVFTMADADHHTENWVWIQDGKEMSHAFELQRMK